MLVFVLCTMHTYPFIMELIFQWKEEKCTALMTSNCCLPYVWMVMRPRSKVDHQGRYRAENGLCVWAVCLGCSDEENLIKKVTLSWVWSVTPTVPTLGLRLRIVEFWRPLWALDETGLHREKKTEIERDRDLET